MARGTIEHLRPGHAGGHVFGVIAPDDCGRTVYFYPSGVEGHLFDQLRVGQRVAFEVARNPGNPLDVRAVRIQTLTD
jgi:cold shock CspA family protein